MVELSHDEIVSLVKQAKIIYMEEDMIDISPAQEDWLLWMFELAENDLTGTLLSNAISFVWRFVSESTSLLTK